MRDRWLSYVHVFAAAAFAGGCLLLSVMLQALFGVAPQEGASIMRALLPRMGSVMAPLLVTAALSALVLAALARRSALMPRTIVASAFVAIAAVTTVVHFPINAEFLEHTGWSAFQANLLLERWLRWHHVRTLLALSALAVLLWPRAPGALTNA